MVITTGVLIAVGIATAVIFWKQFNEMFKQTKILNGQATQGASDYIEAAKRVERQLGIAQDQVKAAQGEVTAIQNQFRLDQRPLIWLASPNTDRPATLDANQIDFGIGPELAVGLAYENFGKSPANIVRQKNGAGFGVNALSNIRMGSNQPAKGFLPPNGTVNFITIVSGPRTQEVITQWLKTDDAIAVRFEVHYTDSLGSLYETNMCWQRLATSAWRTCEPSGIKDCSKERCDKE